MAAHLYCGLISVAIFTTCLQLSFAYSFKNCIESANSNRTIFRCTKRQSQTVTDIVADVSLSATNITIAYCRLSRIHSGSFSNLTKLKVLALNNNHVNTIEKNAFVDLRHLQNLNLSSNEISVLVPTLFRGLHGLTELLLADNNLTTIPLNLFSDLANLQTLDLRRNKLQIFSDVVLSMTSLSMLNKLNLAFNLIESLNHSTSLPQSLATFYLGNNNLKTLDCSSEFLSTVKVLDLSYNKLLSTRSFKGLNLSSITYLRLRSTNVNVSALLDKKYVKASPRHIDFSGLGLNGTKLLMSLCKNLTHSQTKYVKKMVLQSNDIKTLKNNTFSYCPKITELLDLSLNELNPRCLEFLMGQSNIKKLKMEHNHITKLLSCNKKNLSFPNIRELSYRYNRILEVNAFAFSHVPKLEILELNINIIAYLDQNALSGLRDLTFLRLDNNLLSDLFVQSFEDLHKLQRLLLRNNRIAVIFNNTFHSLKNLTILDLGGNKITQFQPLAFEGLESLTNLYLDRNHLTKIDSQLLGGLHGNLRVLDLQANYIFYYEENRDSPFLNLTKLTDLKLDGQLPYGIITLSHAFFRGLTSLERLYLSNNHISFFSPDTFDYLKNLTFLTLDNSVVGLTKLMPGIFKNLRKLEVLLVENMGIASFSKEVFGNLTALKILHLNLNAFQTLDIELLENLTNLRYLDVRKSPISCSCANQDLQNWTKNNQRVQLVYLHDLTCQDLKGSNFYSFDTNVCYFTLELYLFVSTCTVTIAWTLIPLLYIKLFWTFKYGYYVFRSWFGEQWRRLRDQEEKCIYDAFISYNSADEKWVMEQLLPNLEGNGSLFRLCLHHRDFEPGRNIVDNIVSAVYSSRKTVCVVSQNFLRCEWCSLEIQLASYRLFHEMQDVLLLVFLEHIPKRQLSTYHRMRKVMLKKTYLQWPGPDCTDPTKAQQLFWKQLKKALRSSSNTSQEVADNVQNGEQRDEREYFVNQSQMDDEACYLMP